MRALILLCLLTAPAHAQIVLLRAGGVGSSAPVSNGATAATATVSTNAVCTALGSGTGTVVTPAFYMEIGDATGTLWSYSVGGVTATSGFGIASASKMQYGEFLAIKKGGFSGLSTADKAALNFTDGYTNMGDITNGQSCPAPPATSPNGTGCNVTPLSTTNQSVNYCLSLCGTDNTHTNAYQDPATVGTFNYDAGHFENNASANEATLGISNIDTSGIYPIYVAAFSDSTNGAFGQPLMAGGIQTSGQHYALVLQTYLTNTAAKTLLDPVNINANAVCAYTYTAGCSTASGSPIRSKWDYVFGDWWEVDTSSNNDMTLSSPGAFGFYPFVFPTCPLGAHAPLCRSISDLSLTGSAFKYYGLIARYVPSGTSPTGNGQTSGDCAALVRAAWLTGVQQTGTIPSP